MPRGRAKRIAEGRIRRETTLGAYSEVAGSVASGLSPYTDAPYTHAYQAVQTSAGEMAQVFAAQGSEFGRPVTPPMAHGGYTYTDLERAGKALAPRHINAGRIDARGMVQPVSRSPTRTTRLSYDDGQAYLKPEHFRPNPPTKFKGRPDWNGLVHESGNLANPADPFVSANSASSLTRLAGSAPEFIPADKYCNSASPNGEGNGNSAPNDQASNGKITSGNGQGSRDSSSHPVIVSTPTPKPSKGKGKQPVGLRTKTTLRTRTGEPVSFIPTRFLKVHGVRADHFNNGEIMDGLSSLSRFHENVPKLGLFEIQAPNPETGAYDVYIFSDSLSFAKEMYRFLKNEFEVCYVSKKELDAAVKPTPDHVTTYSAKVFVTATVKQSSHRRRFGPDDISEMVKTSLAKFGKIINFRTPGLNGDSGYAFEVEFDSVNDAIDAKLNTDEGVDLNYGRHPHLDMEVKSEDQASGPTSPVTPVSQDPTGSSSPGGSPARLGQDNLQYSPTGRTAVRHGPNGKTSTVPGYRILNRTNAPVTPHRGPQGSHPSSGPANSNQYYDHSATFMIAYDQFQGMQGPVVDGMELAGYRPQDVSDARIEEGHDCRTTLMIRNVPPEFTAELLYQMLLDVVSGEFDFAYNRIDFQANQAVGYAFVNFTSTTALLKFVKKWRGRLLPRNVRRRHQKPCAVSYANVQGYECLVAKFRNSSILDEAAGCRPRLFYSAETAPSPDQVNQERPWPGVDNQAKKNRSVENAQIIGLYARRFRGNGRGRGRRGHSQFDRGTSAQQRDEHQMSYYQYGPPPVFANGQYSQPRFQPSLPNNGQLGWPTPYTGPQVVGPMVPGTMTPAPMTPGPMTPGPMTSGSMLRTHTNGALGYRGLVMPAQMAPVHDPTRPYTVQAPGEFEPLFTPIKGQHTRNWRFAPDMSPSGNNFGGAGLGTPQTPHQSGFSR